MNCQIHFRDDCLVEVPSGSHTLPGILHVPENAEGVVVFAHGSGSGRLSPRNQFVAKYLNEAGLATLLLDLLEEPEADDRRKVFNIELLAERLQSAACWLSQLPETGHLGLGYFGASTGTAAALLAAAWQPAEVEAIVSRGGRPDLASAYLPTVRASTLLIVGGNDPEVLALNRQALNQLHCPKDLQIVASATHLFPEAGALEKVASLARDWFSVYLGGKTGGWF